MRDLNKFMGGALAEKLEQALRQNLHRKAAISVFWESR